MSRLYGSHPLEPRNTAQQTSHTTSAAISKRSLNLFQQFDVRHTSTRLNRTDTCKDSEFRDMAVRGWTPINWIVAGTDDEGNDIHKVVQLALLPSKRQPPVCSCLRRDRPTHHHLFDDYNEEEEDPSPSDLSSSSPKTPGTTKNGVKKTQPKSTPGTTKVEYEVYPIDTTSQAMIDGDPDLLHYENIYRIAQKYNMAELADAVNASHDTTKYTAGLLGNRLQRAVNRKAERDGAAVTIVRQELQKLQKQNGVPLNGRKRKKVVEEIEELRANKKRKANGQSEDEQVAKKQKSDGDGEDKEMKRKRVLPWEMPLPSSPSQSRQQVSKKQKPVKSVESKETVKKRVLPWDILKPSPIQNREQVPDEQTAVEDDEGESKQMSKKRKSKDDDEDAKLVKKPKIVEKMNVELDKENKPKEESSAGKEDDVAKDQTKPDREVLSSGFVMWNI